MNLIKLIIDRILVILSDNAALKSEINDLTTKVATLSQELAVALANDQTDAEAIAKAQVEANEAKAISDQAEAELSQAKAEVGALQAQVKEAQDKLLTSSEVEAGVSQIAEALGLTGEVTPIEATEGSTEVPE